MPATRRFGGAVTTLAAVVLVAGCAGTPAAAPDIAAAPRGSFVVHSTGTAAPFDRYELQDLETFARSSGQPLEDVLAGQRGSNELDALVSVLEEDEASGYVYAGHDPDRPGTAWMTFTARPVGTTLQAIEALPQEVTVTYGLPLAHRSLVAYSEAVAGCLREVPGTRLAMGGPAPRGDRIEVRYSVVPGARRPSAAALQAAALRATRRWSRDGSLRVPVRFLLVPSTARGAVADAP